MTPFIIPNLYHSLSKLPKTDITVDANYYAYLEDLWAHHEPGYEAFFAWAKQRCYGDVSDLGCGSGVVGKKLNAKYFYDFIAGFDGVRELDLTKPITTKLLGDTFILSHCLEHLPKPKDSIKNLFDALNTGSRLIISVPDGAVIESTAIPYNQYIPTNDGLKKHIHHVYAWTTADLFNTLNEQGWDEIDIATANVCGFACIWAFAKRP
jgi:SAM-dependent methyltransferase